MWSAGWAELFGQPATVPTTRPREDGYLYAARWTRDTPEGTHRLSCAHLHRTRSDAERCGASTIALVERMRNDGKVISPSYVADRLARNPAWTYDGVHREEDIT